jgi:hypothetical protein
MSASNSVSSSYAYTASSAISSSYAYSASSAVNSFSASKAVSSSYADTASFSNDFTVLGNLTVYGTQSVQYITSSQLNVSDNVITVNVASPGVRFGGLSVFDSGSLSSEATASLFWDSQNNHWIYQRESGSTYDGGMLISGPRNASGLGNELGTTACMLLVGQGGDHLTSSLVYHDSSRTCFYTNVLSISSSGQFIFGNSPADFSFNVATTCVGTNATVAQFYNNDYTAGTRGFIRVRNGANISGTTSAYIGQGQDSKTYIYNNDPSRPGDIVITGTGLVGIGTCTPTNQLTIAASNSTTAGNICTALTLAGIRLFPISGTTNGLSIGIAGANINYLQAQYSGDCAPAPLSLQPYGGNMGIGTIDIVSTCLSGSLTIRKSYQGDTSNGSTTQNYYINQSALYLFGRNSGLSIIGNNGEEGEIIFGNNSTRAYARIATGTGTTSTGGDMYFKVGGDTERMRITTAGNLLVGGTTAGTGNSIALRGDNQGASGYAYLQVSGCGSATEGIYLYNSSGLAGSIGTNGACTLIFSTFTTERLRISGNCIGINNSNPRASLEINQACSDQNNGGFMFRTLDLQDNTWTSFFTPPANWGGVTTLNWVGTNDFNRSGAAQIRWAYSTATAQLGPVAVFFCDSQNAQPCWRYSGGDLQIYVSGAGAGKRLQAMIMGSRGA